MVFAEAMSYLESYVGGGITSSDANFKQAVSLIASGYGSSIKKWNLTVNGSSTDRFDEKIQAFAYFWKNKFSDKGYDYNLNYIKAMLAVETKVGTYDGSHHGTTDVIQCLDKANPAVYCMAKIKPSNGVAYDANEGLTKGMKSGGYKAIRDIFSGSTPQPSEYNSTLSLCFGILWLGYKTALKGSTKEGVIAYNGGGDSNYWKKVSSCLDDPASYLNV
jgi:hypothetical protein